MRRLLAYLGEHPLVWLVPLAFYTIGIGVLAWKVVQTPVNPFIYDL